MNNGKICISICAETADELIEQIKRAEDLADVIEIRFDCLNESELKGIKTNIKSLREKIKKPFLITFRPKEQGGKRELDYIDDRIGFWLHCREIRGMDFVDIEFDLFCDEGHNWKLYELKNSQFISSYNFPEPIPGIRLRICLISAITKSNSNTFFSICLIAAYQA